MNTNNIEQRIERIYDAIGKHRYENTEEYIKLKDNSINDKLQINILFGNEKESELENYVFNTISNISKLKEYLKDIHYKNGNKKQDIEDEINNSKYLKLVIDLDNKEKHVELEKSRYGEFPYIDGICRAMSMRGSGYFSINLDSQKQTKNGNVALEIFAEIKNKNGNNICLLDELIEGSMNEWEEIMKKYNLV